MTTINFNKKKEANLEPYQNFYPVFLVRIKEFNIFNERISP